MELLLLLQSRSDGGRGGLRLALSRAARIEFLVLEVGAGSAGSGSFGTASDKKTVVVIVVVMGFLSFIGRVTFSAIFILAAWQKVEDFSIDGGGALVGLTPKLDVLLNNINETLYFNLKLPPQLQTKHLLMLAIGLEGIGGLLFTLGSTLGAYMLLLFLALVTPVMHDFYNFDQSSLEYHHQFIGFLKNLSQFGALLFYLGMKNSASRNKMRKKHVTKPKSL